MRGRPRQLDPRAPTHIDQVKLPTGVYFDHRYGEGTWYLLRRIGGKLRRRNLLGPAATLAQLHRRVEEVLADTTLGTMDWLCGLFAGSDQHAALSESTQADYAYCRSILQKRKDKAGKPLSEWPVEAFTAPLVQRLVDDVATKHPAKANHLLRYLRRLFRWGGNRGHCAKVNPAEKIEAARERKKRPIPPPVMMAVIAFAQARGAVTTRTKGSCPPYLWAVAEIAYLCRLRGIDSC